MTMVEQFDDLLTAKKSIVGMAGWKIKIVKLNNGRYAIQCNKNLYLRTDGFVRQEESQEEIFEWYLISEEYYADKLIKAKEPVIKNEYGMWWGRTCFGQQIILDSTFWTIYQEELNKY